MNELPELPPDIAALLDAAREPPAAPASERREVAARVARSTGLAIPGAAKVGATGLAGAWWVKTVGVAALVAAAGVAVRAVPTPSRAVPSPTRVTQTVAHAPAATPRDELPAVTSAAAVAPSMVPARVEATPTATPRRAPVARGDDRLDDELGWIERARAAMSRGAFGDARDALSSHARLHPRGRLSPEREALRVQCAALRGDRDEALAARARFHARYPDSVLGAAVDRAVDATR